MAGLAEALSRLCYFVSSVLTKSGTNRQLKSVSTRLRKIRRVVARNCQSTSVGSGPFPAGPANEGESATGMTAVDTAPAPPSTEARIASPWTVAGAYHAERVHKPSP